MSCGLFPKLWGRPDGLWVWFYACCSWVSLFWRDGGLCVCVFGLSLSLGFGRCWPGRLAFEEESVGWCYSEGQPVAN